MSIDQIGPTGSVVRYHGSLTRAHGKYVVFGPCVCPSCYRQLRDLHEGRVTFGEIKDKIRYKLGTIGDADPENVMEHVRRTSFTVTDDASPQSVF